MKFIPSGSFLMPDINYTDQEHRGELARAGPREAKEKKLRNGKDMHPSLPALNTYW